MKKRRLNIQALSIKEPRVVSNIIAEPGRVFIGEDLVSAEPMVTAILSNDFYYRYAVYDGIGRKPFYKGDILMISDIYIMYASVCPVTASKVKAVFNADEWMKDPEAVKKKLKAERSLCKVVVLSAGYGVGKEKLATIFRENGYHLSKLEVAAAWDAYWGLFDGIRQTIRKLTKKLQDEGYLINLFGYRVAPPNDKDAFNYVCQSSVSGLMNYFMMLKFKHGTHLNQRFITCIHDCLITELPENMVEESKRVTEIALKELNAELEWSIPVRTDFNVSKDFYGLKG